MAEYRVWWIPQVPMKPFRVPVETPEQGRWLCDVLADYDIFQFESNVKPDYCNAGGVQMLDEDGEWVDWPEYDDA
jgi:hypothetical protein